MGPQATFWPGMPGSGPGRWVRGPRSGVFSEERGLAGCLVPLLNDLVFGLSAEHLAVCGACRAAGLSWHCGIRAVLAEPNFLRFLPVFLSMASPVFLTLRGLIPLLLVLAPVLLPGFDLGRGWFGSTLRKLCLRLGLLGWVADGGFPWRLSGQGRPGLGPAPAVFLGEVEGVPEKTSFCRGGRDGPRIPGPNRKVRVSALRSVCPRCWSQSWTSPTWLPVKGSAFCGFSRMVGGAGMPGIPGPRQRRALFTLEQGSGPPGGTSGVCPMRPATRSLVCF